MYDSYKKDCTKQAGAAESHQWLKHVLICAAELMGGQRGLRRGAGRNPCQPNCTPAISDSTFFIRLLAAERVQRLMGRPLSQCSAFKHDCCKLYPTIDTQRTLGYTQHGDAEIELIIWRAAGETHVCSNKQILAAGRTPKYCVAHCLRGSLRGSNERGNY